MPLFSSTQPSLRARILPRFPAQVLAGNGITINKSGGTYVFAATGDVASLAHMPDMQTDRLLGRDTNLTGKPEELTLSGGLGFTGAGGIQLTPNQRLRAIPFTITGAPITAGVKGDILVPFSCIIQQVTLLGDQSPGTITLDIWKDIYANFPPTVADTIINTGAGGVKPSIASLAKGQINVLTGWTTAITAGDILRFNVDAAATLTRVQICIDVVTV